MKRVCFTNLSIPGLPPGTSLLKGTPSKRGVVLTLRDPLGPRMGTVISAVVNDDASGAVIVADVDDDHLDEVLAEVGDRMLWVRPAPRREVIDPPCLHDADALPEGLAAPRYWWHDLGNLLAASLFEADYCERSDAIASVTTLRSWGRYPEPCDCGFESGPHWAMGYQWEDATVIDMLGPPYGSTMKEEE